jgi:hypothetical protein
MRRAYRELGFGLFFVATLVAAGFGGCSSNGEMTSTSGSGGHAPDGGTGAGGAKDGGATGSGGSIAVGSGGSGGGTGGSPDGGCPSSCAELDANCGSVTDTRCGGVVQCGDCPAGMACGVGGTANQCSAVVTPDACSPHTCQGLGLSCGPVGDGCGGTLQCGSCTLPQICGGVTPGQCGCSGVCAAVPLCAAGTTTTLTGKVYDPAGMNPLYNALVYIPNDPSDPGLMPFQPGVTCDQCGATAAGDPLVSTSTAPDGTFTLQGVPVGPSVLLVVQLGRWRRQFTVGIPDACMPNAIADHTLLMPANHTQGDIPYMALLTGNVDPVECVLRQIGIDDSEFTDPGEGGHINFYLSDDSISPSAMVSGSGSSISATTPYQSSLFSGQTLNQYDLVILECEGYVPPEDPGELAALLAYTAAGGHVFASDRALTWLYQNGSFATVAGWNYQPSVFLAPAVAVIDQVSNPEGPELQQWLQIVGASVPGSGVVSVNPAFQNTTGVVAPTQQWLHDQGALTPIHFTFNTPVGAPAAQQCGRVVFSDWHAQDFVFSSGTTFPTECPATAMTPQEAILEFMLFDATACVQPYTPACTPTTCEAQNLQCGPAGDGCGGLLQCGDCTPPAFCGGGGPSMCGSSVCKPETCMTQGIQCGLAGDGCGDTINCGNCPTGEVCGVTGPGLCSHPM